MDDGSCKDPVVTSLEDLEQDPGVKIFPSPFENHVSISFSQERSELAAKYDLTILDIYGRERLVEISLDPSKRAKIQVDTRHLEQGIYFLILTETKTRASYMIERIIKW